MGARIVCGRVASGRRTRVLFCAVLFGALLPACGSAASLDVYLSPPGDQSTGITNAATETFNSLSVGIKTSALSTAIGIYEFSPTSPMAIVGANAYGGANNSNYLSLGAQSGSVNPVALQLFQPATYFGFWWSAGDANNGISFYYNSTMVGHLNTADVSQLLNGDGGMVTALNGVQYLKADYFGNPNNEGDKAETFAYVNIFAVGTIFNRVVFDNSDTTATGLESDNHSVYLGAAQPKVGSVYVESAPAFSVNPEPPMFALAATGLLGLFALLRIRNKV